MATGILKSTTKVALKVESTAGTYEAPSASTDYLQPLEDGIELTPAKENLARAILTSSIGKAKPLNGLESVSASIPVEFRASGVEGDTPDFDLLLKGILGNSRNVATQTTTGTTHTTTVLNIATADSIYAVGDIIVILESADQTVHFCTAVDSSTLTYSPARSVAPSDAVLVAKLQTYFPADSGHESLSASIYWGDEIRSAAIGCKVASMSVENFTPGQLATFNFGLEGLDFSEIDGVAPQTPSYDTGLPPVLVNACLYQDGVQIDVSNFSMSVTNTVSVLSDTCNGNQSNRVSSREISGSFTPYKDDTSVDQFDKFDASTNYSLIITAYTPSSTTGEISLGSVVGIYLPNCISVEKTVGDVDGVLSDEVSFQGHRGTAGDTDEIYIGMV